MFRSDVRDQIRPRSASSTQSNFCLNFFGKIFFSNGSEKHLRPIQIRMLMKPTSLKPRDSRVLDEASPSRWTQCQVKKSWSAAPAIPKFLQLKKPEDPQPPLSIPQRPHHPTIPTLHSDDNNRQQTTDTPALNCLNSSLRICAFLKSFKTCLKPRTPAANQLNLPASVKSHSGEFLNNFELLSLTAAGFNIFLTAVFANHLYKCTGKRTHDAKSRS